MVAAARLLARLGTGRLLGCGGIGANLGNLSILLSGRAQDTDGSNDLAVGNNWDATLKWGRTAKAERTHTNAALRYQVFKDLARPLEIERGMGFVLGDANTAVLGVIKPMQHHDMAGAVQDNDGHWPIVLHRFCLGGHHRLLGRLESNRWAVGCCGWWRGLLSARRGCDADKECCCDNEMFDFIQCFLPRALFLAPRANTVGEKARAYYTRPCNRETRIVSDRNPIVIGSTPN